MDYGNARCTLCFFLFFGGPFFAVAVSFPLRCLLCDDIPDQAVTMTVLFFVESVAILYWAWSKLKPKRAGECIACSEADAAALMTTLRLLSLRRRLLRPLLRRLTARRASARGASPAPEEGGQEEVISAPGETEAIMPRTQEQPTENQPI
jgi:hypothetical protein